MFAEVKSMLPVSGNDYDPQIITQIKAAVLDLESSTEIVLPGRVNITRRKKTTTGVLTATETDEYEIVDNSTLKDELIITAISIWCNMRIGNPPNYDNLLKAYESLKGQMRLSRKYTRFPGGGAYCADDDQL